MQPGEPAAYRFGPYELHPRARELYKLGTKLKLRPQPFQVLQVLLEHAGGVVTRDELRQILWPSETFVNFELGLNTSVKELRRVLCDSANEPRYIETIPKLGYRLVAPVEPVGPIAQEEPAVQPVVAEPPPPQPQLAGPPTPRRLTWLIAAGASVVLLAALAAYWRAGSSPIPRQAADGRLMLAVLPFENLTGDASQEYFSDGLTEEMIAQLGRVDPEHFGVIARTSVMHYKQTQARLDQIGRELNVQYVLEGSVRKDRDNVRVSAQLIRVEDQSRAWAREYDRRLTSLLALQGEIAREISDEIELAFGTHKPRSRASAPPVSAARSDAYNLYLKGLYFWNKRSAEAFRQAIEYFQQSIASDPDYAPAYAGLADCYALLGGYTMEPRPEYITQARAAALHALELDDKLPEAHTALAVIVQNYDHDWQTAGNEYRRAIELNPSYATAHHWYAEHLGYLGRFEEAFRESERARQLDPLSLIIAADNGVLLYYSRQYGRAIEKCHSVLEMDANFTRAIACLAKVYAAGGMVAEALRFYEPLRKTYADRPFLWSELAYIYGRSGQREEALRALETLKRFYRPEISDPETLVRAYLGLGDKDQAFSALEKCYAQHSTLLTMLKVDPLFDPLRGDARFDNLLRRVGLAR